MKSKVKTDKVEIIKDVEFFKRLQEVGITKNSKTRKNLCKFLTIDEANYLNLLMVKKIGRAILDF